MSELQKFKDDLERELVAAAHRRNLAAAATSARNKQLKPILAVTLAMGAITLGVFGIPMVLDSTPAAADAIAITQLQDRVEIRVIDVVNDPGTVAAKLEDELGIRADMLPVPAPPELIGRVNAVGNIGPVEPEVKVSSDGQVELVTLPVGFSGILIIEYGRRAAPGETYIPTVTDTRCAQLFGLTPSSSFEQLEGLEGSLRFETVNADGQVGVDVDPQTIPDHYQLTDLMALSSNSYLVTFSEDPGTEQVHPNCR